MISPWINEVFVSVSWWDPVHVTIHDSHVSTCSTAETGVPVDVNSRHIQESYGLE